MVTEPQTVGEITTRMTTETKRRLQESPASTGNTKTVEKEVTRLFIFGQRKENRKTTKLTISSWEPHSAENSRKRTMNKIRKNG